MKRVEYREIRDIAKHEGMVADLESPAKTRQANISQDGTEVSPRIDEESKVE